jgi:uncharacterized glyoxalase superfamily protein PhnB
VRGWIELHALALQGNQMQFRRWGTVAKDGNHMKFTKTLMLLLVAVAFGSAALAGDTVIQLPRTESDGNTSIVTIQNLAQLDFKTSKASAKGTTRYWTMDSENVHFGHRYVSKKDCESDIPTLKKKIQAAGSLSPELKCKQKAL